MIYYIFIVTLILLFSSVSLFSKSANRTFLLISCFLLSLFSGLRSLGTSADDLNYYYSLYYKSFSFEYMYTFLEKFIAYNFNSNINILFFIASIFSMFFLYLGLYRYKKICVISIFIYACHVFLYRDMIQIRAAIAYNIAILIMIYIEQGKSRLKTYPLILLSVGFHLSAIFSFLFEFIKKIKIDIPRFNVLIIICFVFSIFAKKLLYAILGGLSYSYLNVYLDTYLFDDGGYVYSLGYFNPTLIKSLFFSYIFIYHRDKFLSKFSTNVFLNAYIISFLISLAFVDFSVFSLRMASLFSCAEIILVPTLIFSFNKNKYSYAVFFLVIYILILSLNIFYKGMLNGYSTILF